MVRTLEGKETHRKLMEKSAEYLRKLGFQVVFQARINDGRVDVVGIKGDEKVGIECQVVPNWKVLVEKTKRYKKDLSRFIVAIPAYVRPRLKPVNVDVIQFDVPKISRGKRILVSLSEEIEEKFRKRVKEKYGDKRGAISIVVEHLIKEWLKEDTE